MWPTRSPSRWTRRELQVGVDRVIKTQSTSTRTPRPSARGPCGLLRLGPRVDGHRESFRSRSKSGSGSMWPTRSPSRGTRRELQFGVDRVIKTQSTSTRTPRPSARGPCGLLRLGPRVDGHRESFRSRSKSGSGSMWPTRSPSRGTRRELQVGVDRVIKTQSTSTRTPRPSARGPCGLLRLGPRVDGHRESFRSRSKSGSGSMWPTRSPSRGTRRELQFGVDRVIKTQSTSTRTPRPSARGPCGLLRLGPRVDGHRESFRAGSRSRSGSRIGNALSRSRTNQPRAPDGPTPDTRCPFPALENRTALPTISASRIVHP